MVQLDDKDNRILSFLDQNSRATFSEIGRRLHLSPQTVKYHIEKLISEGVLTDFWPMVDFRKIGYTNIAYFFQLNNISNESEKKLTEYLMATNDINIAMKGDGFWDLHMTISTKGIFSNQKIFEHFYERFHDLIVGYHTGVPVGFYQFPREYLQKKSPPHTHALTGDDAAEVAISDIQKKILEQVNQNSRITYNELANELCISRQAAVRNLDYLEKSGVIQSYAIWIHHETIDYSLYRTLLKVKSFNTSRYKTFFSYCERHPNIIHFLKMVGTRQLLLDIEITSRHNLRQLTHEMKNTFSDVVERIEPTLVYDIITFRDIPLSL